MSTSVVAYMDASPVLEPGKHVLDPMSFAIEEAIIVVLDAVAGMRRDAGRDALIGQGLAKAAEP